MFPDNFIIWHQFESESYKYYEEKIYIRTLFSILIRCEFIESSEEIVCSDMKLQGRLMEDILQFGIEG